MIVEVTKNQTHDKYGKKLAKKLYNSKNGDTVRRPYTPKYSPMITPYLNRFAYILAGAALVTNPAAFAADASWNVNSSSTWATGSNWTPASAPGATSGTTNQDTATFSSSVVTAARTVTVDNGRNIKNITINVNGFAGAYTPYSLTGSGNSLLLTSGGTLSVTGATNVTGSGAFTTAAVAPTSMVMQGNYTFSVDTTTTAGKFGQFFIGSAATVSGASGLGAATLTLSGQTVLNTTNAVGDQIAGTAGGVVNGVIANGTGNTLSVVKEGTGAWELKTANTFSGGLTIKQGTIVASTLDTGLGTGGVTLGESGSANNAALLLGSGRNIANSLTVNNGAGLRTLGGNNGTTDTTYSGAITLNGGAKLRIQKASSKNVIISGGITGTGDVEAYDNSATAATGVVFSGAINNVGKVTNAGPGVGTLTQSGSGVIGSNVTELVQNSSTSKTTLSLTNSYVATSVLAGTLETTGSGTLGTGDVTVNGGSLLLGSSVSLSDTAILKFISSGTATITLNNASSDTVYAIYNLTTGASIGIGTWTSAQLNSFFGTSNFTGSGTLTTLAAVPEPSTVGAAIFVLGIMVVTHLRRRSQAVR